MKSTKKDIDLSKPGGRVKAIRLENHLTQAEFAKALQKDGLNNHYLTADHVSKIERGERSLQEHQAKAMEEKFGVSVAYLMCHSEYKTESERDISSVLLPIIEKRLRRKALESFLQTIGVAVETNVDEKYLMKLEEANEEDIEDAVCAAEKWVKSDKPYRVVKLKNRNTLGYLDEDSFDYLIASIYDFVEFQLNKYVKGGE